MNALCLPDHLAPLLMHIEPLLAAADKYQLGEAVSMEWSGSEVVDIHLEGTTFKEGDQPADPRPYAHHRAGDASRPVG